MRCIQSRTAEQLMLQVRAGVDKPHAKLLHPLLHMYQLNCI
jgi:hypothetical protein